MNRQRKARPRRISLCAEFHEDDGIDPRRFFKRQGQRDDRKIQQLCKQVSRTLSFVLGGECHDHLLRELVVQSVAPAPDSSRLLVVVQLAPTAPQVTHDEILGRLQRAQPFLRQEVAAAICRKKAPDLTFQVMPRQEVWP